MSEQKLLETIIRSKNPVDTAAISYAGAQLMESDLSNAGLEGANLSNANLKSADLRNANLRNANLEGADLSGAYLKKADLSGADLTDAIITGTYFNEANLLGAIGLKIENLQLTKSLYEAGLDSTLRFTIEQCCPEKFKDPKWQWNSNEWSRGVEFDTKAKLPKNEEMK
ncbi:MAG: hypothetical protein GF350_14050 [Chitinivibrionales bacterium]|nr:hypothetical protein [Chitinivibrionales bacterium]